jgi:hypothetical protein
MRRMHTFADRVMKTTRRLAKSNHVSARFVQTFLTKVSSN